MTVSAKPFSSPLIERYGGEARHLEDVDGYAKLEKAIGRGSCRSFQDQAVDADLIQLLCAAALASPTKSDLQQRDIIVIQNEDLKQQIISLMPEQSWIADIPCR